MFTVRLDMPSFFVALVLLWIISVREGGGGKVEAKPNLLDSISLSYIDAYVLLWFKVALSFKLTAD